MYKLFLCLILPLCAFAQSAPGPTATAASSASLPPPPVAPDGPELTQLLRNFLAGASRNDLSAHERFWADDLIYTGSSGRRIGKADIIGAVKSEGAPKPGADNTIYTAEDIRIQQYGSAAIVAFRLVGTTTKGDKTEIGNYLNSGTFLKRDGKWQVVNWQATKLPEGKDQTK